MRRGIVSFVLLSACDPGGWKSIDTGTTHALRSVFVEAEDRVWLAGDKGTVLFFDGENVTDTSTDAGVKVFVEIPDMYGVASSSGETAIAGDEGLAMTLRDGVWTFDDSSTRQRMLTMVRPAPSQLYAAGENGRVIRRRVGETSWERVDVNAPTNAKITGSWANSERTIAFTTDAGVVLELVEDAWIAQTVATSTSSLVPLFGVWSSTRGADLVAVGLAGLAYRRPEGQVAWETEDTGSNADLYGIFGASSDEVYAVGSNGTVLLYDGAGWGPVPSASSRNLYAIHGLADGSVIVAAGDEGSAVILRR
jgi:hypothetical protein